MHRALIAAATLLLGVTPFAPNVALPKGRRRGIAPQRHAPRPQPQLQPGRRRETLLYVAIDDGSSINNGSVTPMIHACLSRQPNRYEAVVTLARKAKQRTLLDQVAGQQNTEGIKPLLQQMREETRLWDEDPQRDEPGEAFSWPPKIGVTWTDDGKADLEVMGSQTRVPGEDG
jgi:DNA-directed RNA polymerase subunit K/omega